MEYVKEGILFDVCQSLGGLGEDAGRFFLAQILDYMKYMDKREVVHRDLKLENILVDAKMNIKVADFGFACMQSPGKILSAYGGTKSYMAPEILQRSSYDGRKIDMFAIGVIMFIIVVGNFPFQTASQDDAYYKLLVTGSESKKRYWRAVRGSHLSDDFKKLLISMLHIDPSKRPSVRQVEKSDWMQTPIKTEKIRKGLVDKMDWSQMNKSTSSVDEEELNI